MILIQIQIYKALLVSKHNKQMYLNSTVWMCCSEYSEISSNDSTKNMKNNGEKDGKGNDIYWRPFSVFFLFSAYYIDHLK